jgi:hypothetical protein
MAAFALLVVVGAGFRIDDLNAAGRGLVGRQVGDQKQGAAPNIDFPNLYTSFLIAFS